MRPRPSAERVAPHLAGTVRLPSGRAGPIARLGLRVLLALALLMLVALVAYADREGYRDGDELGIDFVDALYYATVSITTTGYGDITPLTERARLLTIFLVTPARVLFLILLVGTTLEVLAEGSRAAFRERGWRRRLRDHTIICGYGTKGKSAVTTLRAHDVDLGQVVIIDPNPRHVEEANAAGLAAVQGDAARAAVLAAAGASDAARFIIAVDRDDTAVLATLTARELNPEATIVAAVREEENRHLLHQSGASSVITTSASAGRLLGFAAQTPRVVEVLEDLLIQGSGIDLIERPIRPEEVGPLERVMTSAPVLAVVRDDALIRWDDERAQVLHAGDRLLCLCTNEPPPQPAA